MHIACQYLYDNNTDKIRIFVMMIKFWKLKDIEIYDYFD